MQTHRLHTRAEWLRVQQRYRQVLYAYTVPLWARQESAAYALPWRLWVYCWQQLPAVVNTVIRWAPFLVVIAATTRPGGWSGLKRLGPQIPGDLVRGAGRLVTDPTHSALALLHLWFPWGLGAVLLFAAVAQRRLTIPLWWPFWTWLWMLPWTVLLDRWAAWWGGGGPSWAFIMTSRPRPRAPVAPDAPDWVDYQMAREARHLGIDWVPRRLRSLSKGGPDASKTAPEHPTRF